MPCKITSQPATDVFFRRRSKIDHVSLGGLGGVGGAEGFLRDEIERQVNPKVWIDMCTQKLYVYFLFEHNYLVEKL